MAVLVGLLLLSTVSPHKAWATGGPAIATTVTEAENQLPTVQVPAPWMSIKPVHPIKLRPTALKKEKTKSEFVRLGQLLVNDAPVCDDEFEYPMTTVAPAVHGCVANDQGLQWAFGACKDFPGGLAGHCLIDGDPSESQRTIIQPRALHLGQLTPTLKQPFTLRGKSRSLRLSDISLADDTWFLEQLFPLVDADRIISANPPASGLGQQGSPFAYRYSVDRKTSLIAEVGWISDIGDTTGMSQAFAQAGHGAPANTMSAVNVTVGARYSNLTLTGGYIRAIEEMDHDDEFMSYGQSTDPMAWCSELAYNTTFLNHPAALAIVYQKSSEALSSFLPEERYTTKASILLYNSTRLSLEYYQDREYSSDNSMDEEDDYGITTRLGFQF
jgi:hypothetical protein